MKEKTQHIVICGVIAAVIFLAYGRAAEYGFVNLDDIQYVYENEIIKEGLSVKGLVWAFSNNDVAYWHPLTWISHMLDCQFFGLNPGMHHAVNLVFHFLNSLLLYGFLRRITGELWPSLLVGLLFAAHPINVESVVWIAERKNVLSTFFGMLTMIAYAAYAKKPGLPGYLLVFFCYLLGLMAKPMLISLPFLLLLLDYWPLRRWRPVWAGGDDRAPSDNSVWECRKRPLRVLLLEKTPFWVMGIVSVQVSISSARDASVKFAETVPLTLRVENAVVSIVQYLGKLVWPADLAVYYPYPAVVAGWKVAVALAVLVAITGLCLRYVARYPFFAVGWLWFLVSVGPVLGLIQAGLWPALADRWAYVPFIGLFIMLAWGGCAIGSRYGYRKALLPIGALAIVSLMVGTSRQVKHWENNITLYQRAIDVTENNDVAHNNLGAAFYDGGRRERSIFHFVEAIRILPGYEKARTNLHVAISENGKPMIWSVERLIVLFPGNAGLHYSLGGMHRDEENYPGAISEYKRAIAIRPDFPLALYNLALVYSIVGEYDLALDYFQRNIELQPGDAEIYYFKACVYAKKKMTEESVRWLKQAVKRGFDDWEFLTEDVNLENIRHTRYYMDLVHDKTKL